jgi:hypothetical protein
MFLTKVAGVWFWSGSGCFLVNTNPYYQNFCVPARTWTWTIGSTQNQFCMVLFMFEPVLNYIFNPKRIFPTKPLLQDNIDAIFCFCTSWAESSIQCLLSAALLAATCTWRYLCSFLYFPLTVWIFPKLSGRRRARRLESVSPASEKTCSHRTEWDKVWLMFLTRDDSILGLDTCSGRCRMLLMEASVEYARADLSRVRVDLYLLYNTWYVMTRALDRTISSAWARVIWNGDSISQESSGRLGEWWFTVFSYQDIVTTDTYSAMDYYGLGVRS